LLRLCGKEHEETLLQLAKDAKNALKLCPVFRYVCQIKAKYA
jgi:hypothetical protein